uniref:Archease domain-containing protein n=1 Tax=Angiostrongylus cantonensis TaxID=6313 RepID=A0A0K0CX41_ANGCA
MSTKVNRNRTMGMRRVDVRGSNTYEGEAEVGGQYRTPHMSVLHVRLTDESAPILHEMLEMLFYVTM